MGDRAPFEPDPDPKETARLLVERTERLKEMAAQRGRKSYRRPDPEDSRLPYKDE